MDNKKQKTWWIITKSPFIGKQKLQIGKKAKIS